MEPATPTTDAASVVLSVRGMSVRAGGVPLLDGVTFDLRRGEIVALVGPSGCGKSTLLRAVSGLSDASGGEVLLGGRAGSDADQPEFRRAMPLLAQTPVMLPGTVRENLARPFAYAAARREFPAERAVALLDRLHVGGERLDQAAETLSVGQQQRVALVRALLLEPRALLLDEPTSALDRAAAESVETVLREEADAGRIAALVVTHDAAQAERLADRTIDLGSALHAD